MKERTPCSNLRIHLIATSLLTSLSKSNIMAPHLHSDLPPGTVHLVDLAGTLHVRHEEGAEKDIVLLPQPTNEYDDPLNWVKKRKMLSAFMLLLAVFSADVMTTLLSVSLLDIEASTGIPLAHLNTGVGLQYLFYGWSNVLWQPLGLTYGRRPMILLGAAGMLGCSVCKLPSQLSADHNYISSVYEVLKRVPHQ